MTDQPQPFSSDQEPQEPQEPQIDSKDTDPLESDPPADPVVDDCFVTLTTAQSDQIRRPTPPNAEARARLLTARTTLHQTEADRMQAMINMPPAFDQEADLPDEDPEISEIATVISPETPAVENISEISVPPTNVITKSIDSTEMTLDLIMQFPDHQVDQVSRILGLADTNLDEDSRFSSDIPMHVPVTSAEIKQTIKLSKQDLVEKINEQPKQVQVQLANSSTKTETARSEIVHDQITSKPEESALPQIDPISQEDPVISSVAVNQNQEAADLIDRILEKSEEKSEEEKVFDNFQSTPSNLISDVATSAEIENALDDIPVLHGSAEINDITDFASDGVDQAIQDENTAPDDLIDSALALAIESTGRLIYGDDYKPLFTAADLEISLDQMDPTTLVIPNVAMDDLTQYCVQSTPKVIRDATNGLYRGIPNVKERIAPEIDKISMAISDPSSYLYRMHASRQFFNTPSRGFYHDLLRSAHQQPDNENKSKPVMSRAVKLRDKDGNITTVDDTKGDKSVVLSKLKDGSIITGTSSFKMASLLINGIRKVNLYNSGFFVVLLAPKIDLLTKYYNSVRSNSGDYGRILGQFSFLPAGVEIRAALFDLVEKLVIDSNLVDYDKPGILRQAVSNLDYSTLIWAIASLMYPKGVEVESVCYNNMPDGKKCRHVESLKIDINSMRFNNWSLLTQEAIFFTDSKEPRILDQLVDYRRKYLADDEVEYTITTDGAWKAYLSIPNVFETEMAQRAYIAQMITQLQVSNEEKLEQYVRAKYLTSFIPYVKKVTYTDPESGKSLIFKDPLALINALDNLQLREDVNLGDSIVNFLSSKTVTHICFAHHPCPVCGQYPPEAINRLIACDPEYAFFMWATARIPQ